MVSGCWPGLQPIPDLGIDGRQRIEGLDVDVLVRRHAVHVQDLAESRPLLPPRLLDHAANHHPLPQAILFDHRPRHEGVRPFARVVVLRTAEEPVTVGMEFEESQAGLQGSIGIFDRLDVRQAFDVVKRLPATTGSPVVGWRLERAELTFPLFLFPHNSPRKVPAAPKSVCRHIGSVSPETKNEMQHQRPWGLEDCLQSKPRRNVTQTG